MLYSNVLNTYHHTVQSMFQSSAGPALAICKSAFKVSVKVFATVLVNGVLGRRSMIFDDAGFILIYCDHYMIAISTYIEIQYLHVSPCTSNLFQSQLLSLSFQLEQSDNIPVLHVSELSLSCGRTEPHEIL